METGDGNTLHQNESLIIRLGKILELLLKKFQGNQYCSTIDTKHLVKLLKHETPMIRKMASLALVLQTYCVEKPDKSWRIQGNRRFITDSSISQKKHLIKCERCMYKLMFRKETEKDNKKALLFFNLTDEEPVEEFLLAFHLKEIIEDENYDLYPDPKDSLIWVQFHVGCRKALSLPTSIEEYSRVEIRPRKGSNKAERSETTPLNNWKLSKAKDRIIAPINVKNSEYRSRSDQPGSVSKTEVNKKTWLSGNKTTAKREFKISATNKNQISEIMLDKKPNSRESATTLERFQDMSKQRSNSRKSRTIPEGSTGSRPLFVIKQTVVKHELRQASRSRGRQSPGKEFTVKKCPKETRD